MCSLFDKFYLLIISPFLIFNRTTASSRFSLYVSLPFSFITPTSYYLLIFDFSHTQKPRILINDYCCVSCQTSIIMSHNLLAIVSQFKCSSTNSSKTIKCFNFVAFVVFRILISVMFFYCCYLNNFVGNFCS